MKNQNLIDKIEITFKKLYNVKPVIVRSPGRINLIGEHTDYNDGFVFPAAIDKEIILAIAANTDNKIRLHAIDENDFLEIDDDQVKPSDKRWANYLLGVVDVLEKKGFNISGFDCVFGGNIPLGAGLSSSAALENAMSFALNSLFSLGLEPDELALIGQKAEHTYAGTKCGIMDQFASMNGQKNRALLLDCRSLEYQFFPLELGKYEILLIDTKVKHELASSEYNDRRADCEQAVAKIKKRFSHVESLRDVEAEVLNECKTDLTETEFKRSLYVVNEITRTLEASEALSRGDIKELGKLMYETHHGLSENYEVSCEELDFLVEKAHENEYVLGARMMGGGFGGCTINILPKVKVKEFTVFVANKYKKRFQVEPGFYDVEISDGTGLI